VNASLDPPANRDPNADWREGARALREGRPGEALAAFRRIIETGPAPAAVWIGVAMAGKALDDPACERAALEQALAQEPRNLHALMMTADHHTRAGDARAANAYYTAVVKVAVDAGAVDPAMQAEVGRAHHMTQRFSAAYEAHLLKTLASRPLDRPEARRFRQSLDLLLGKSEIYPQRPRHYYFPELPHIGYADRSAFPWMDRVEAATDDIRAELLRVIEEDGAFAPYLEPEPNRPQFGDNALTANPDWSAFYLWKGGEPVPENIARCPSVMAALQDAPLCRIPGRTPSVLFSLLRPGAHIAPHHGFTNARFICHLPLIVPEGCALRVGAETRAWSEGKACLFDDSIEHEAWNRHPERLRVVLIFDIWRPELNETERELVSALLQAVDAFGGTAPAWEG
jgi:aspartate beta-hydroxylase